MKTRQGFVSNSSTSSFVLVGFYLKTKNYPTKKLEALQELTEPYGIQVISYGDEEGFVPKGRIFVGSQLMRIRDEGMHSEMPFTEAMSTINSLREILGEPVAELPAIIIGTMGMS